MSPTIAGPKPTDELVQIQTEPKPEITALTIGLNVGKLTPTGFELPENLPQWEWVGLVKQLFENHKSLHWAIGDALAYGKDHYGEAGYKEVAKATGYAVGHLYDIASVSRRVPPSVRTETLLWSHHRAVAALEPDEQKRWLALAAEWGLSVTQLKWEINKKIGLVSSSGYLRLDPGKLVSSEEQKLIPPELLPPMPPETVIQEAATEIPKPRAKKLSPLEREEAKWFKELVVETHLTYAEKTALSTFAEEKSINLDIAIRALVAIGLHGSGHLQKVGMIEAAFESERAYLHYLGEKWYGDPEKFSIETAPPEQEIEVPDPREYTGIKTIEEKIADYVEKCAHRMLHYSDMTTIEDVQCYFGRLTAEQAAIVLEKARNLLLVWEEQKTRLLLDATRWECEEAIQLGQQVHTLICYTDEQKYTFRISKGACWRCFTEDGAIENVTRPDWIAQLNEQLEKLKPGQPESTISEQEELALETNPENGGAP